MSSANGAQQIQLGRSGDCRIRRVLMALTGTAFLAVNLTGCSAQGRASSGTSAEALESSLSITTFAKLDSERVYLEALITGVRFEERNGCFYIGENQAVWFFGTTVRAKPGTTKYEVLDFNSRKLAETGTSVTWGVGKSAPRKLKPTASPTNSKPAMSANSEVIATGLSGKFNRPSSRPATNAPTIPSLHIPIFEVQISPLQPDKPINQIQPISPPKRTKVDECASGVRIESGSHVNEFRRRPIPKQAVIVH